MALFGSINDIKTFKIFTKEVIEDIVSQEIGYYKIMLDDTTNNVYGEAINKYYIGPVLIPCLIDRGDYSTSRTDYGPDRNRVNKFNFFKDHLIEADIVPEIGDVVMYNELYYEVDDINENQHILGKDADYSYSTATENFGTSYSIILTTHYTSPDKLGIIKQRL